MTPEVTQTVNRTGLPVYISAIEGFIGKKGKGKFIFNSYDESKEGSYRNSHFLEPKLYEASFHACTVNLGNVLELEEEEL